MRGSRRDDGGYEMADENRGNIKLEFTGANGSGKTLIMNVISENLSKCGCKIIKRDNDFHKLIIKVEDMDVLGKESRKITGEKE